MADLLLQVVFEGGKESVFGQQGEVGDLEAVSVDCQRGGAGLQAARHKVNE